MAQSRTAVIAIGGNALTLAGEQGTHAEELAHARVVARGVVRLVEAGWRVALTHGNGPQVGLALQRSELAADADTTLPRATLDACVAETQGSLGSLVARAVADELRRAGQRADVIAIVTHALVSLDDPAFAHPTKPIGPLPGHRRQVASPKPLRIIESAAVAALLREGFVTIAAGGGGVPVVRDAEGATRGVEAVIDKDYASALLAIDLRAALLVFLTSVPRIALEFGTPRERPLDQLTADTAETLLRQGQFPAGSMGPKVESALWFLRASGDAHDVVVTSPDLFIEATCGRGGTRIVPSERYAPLKEATR